MKHASIVSLLLLLLASTRAAASDTSTAVSDLPYVENGSPEQTMDIFWPRKRPSATVLFIHGGSLQESGEKRSSPVYRDVCVPFVRAGFACASIDYRSAPKFTWPVMPNDVAAAISALRKFVAARGADPKRMFLFGHSSGCHLAAIVATNPVHLQTVGLKPSDLAGVIAMGCTLDREDAALRGLTADRIRAPFMADPVEVATYGSPEAWLAANPASFIGPHVPPMLVVLARAERFAPPILEQAARFARWLREAGVPADLVVVSGKHMSSVANISVPGDPTFSAIQKFISEPQQLGAEK